jgi:hypothetical protein
MPAKSLLRRRHVDGECHTCGDVHVRTSEVTMKGASKPKKLAKKQPQKTLKEKRNEKRAAAKKNFGSG